MIVLSCLPNFLSISVARHQPLSCSLFRVTSLSRPSHDYLISLASWAAAAASPIIASDDCYWVRGAARVCRHPSSVSRCHTLITPTASPVMSRFRFSISVADFHLFTILSLESYPSSHLLPLITRAREGERTSSQPSLAISSSRSALFGTMLYSEFSLLPRLHCARCHASGPTSCFAVSHLLLPPSTGEEGIEARVPLSSS